MTFEQIRSIIEEDYNNVAHVSSGGRGSKKTFYLDFIEALEVLHRAVSPFIVGKEQFIDYIKYTENSVKPKVYEIVLDYCHNKLKLDI